MAVTRVWLVVLASVAATAQGPRCPPASAQCLYDGTSLDEYFYQIKGAPLTVKFEEAKHFHLSCREDLSLEDAALPRFEHATTVPLVKLSACAPPAAGYALALRALNVRVGAAGTLELDKQPARPALGARHLRGLTVGAFALTGARLLHPEADLLDAFAELRDLRLKLVALPSLRPPPTLRSLQLGGVVAPALDFAHLPELERLVLANRSLAVLDLGSAAALLDARIQAPLESVAVGPRLASLWLVEAKSGELRGDCSGLRNVTAVSACTLPPGWLALCGGVERAAVRNVRARAHNATCAVNADVLLGARSLLSLEMTNCAMRALPGAWLADAGALRELDVSHNMLEGFPSELASLASLVAVRATHNRLRRPSVAQLAALPALTTLTLDYNPLGDLCGGSDALLVNAPSPLQKAGALRSLGLRNTSLTRICRDWRLGLPLLERLDLRDNAIVELGPDEMRWRRDRRERSLEVDLRGNAARAHYERPDYDAALRATTAADGPATTLRLDRAAPCDCYEYWFARAWRERPQHAPVQLRTLLCEGAPTSELLRTPPERLQCALPRSVCPAGCECRATGAATELRCERANLTGVPRAAASLPPVRALLLRGNRVARVHVDDVPPESEEIDLRDNAITRIDAATTEALFARQRRVLLAGNPLACSCEALPLLRALEAARRRDAGGAGPRCADGRAVAAAAAACVGFPLWVMVACALAVAAVSMVAAACMVHPANRHRVKMFLFERGLCLSWQLRPVRVDDGRPYDAFVSFSHLDRSFVDELTRRLEAGPQPRRLCLHERDWLPGDWIPAQIERSVRESRRTLVLLSDNFLRSTWARAELREAYAAALRDERPRLLLLLLPALDPAAAQRDPSLRNYLAAVTYLRWDDVRLWDKLNMALPARAAAPAPTAPPPPP